MKEELISFETAKLAKEKGFRGIGDYYYCFEINGKAPFEIDAAHCHRVGREELETFEAPTQSLLQKWLREEHGIYIYVDPKTTVTMTPTYVRCNCSWVMFKNGRLVNSKRVDGLKVNSTYEEALEKGLYEALKLIKI